MNQTIGLQTVSDTQSLQCISAPACTPTSAQHSIAWRAAYAGPLIISPAKSSDRRSDCLEKIPARMCKLCRPLAWQCTTSPQIEMLLSNVACQQCCCTLSAVVLAVQAALCLLSVTLQALSACPKLTTTNCSWRLHMLLRYQASTCRCSTAVRLSC
jgi:hypothetical protein